VDVFNSYEILVVVVNVIFSGDWAHVSQRRPEAVVLRVLNLARGTCEVSPKGISSIPSLYT